MFGSLPASGSSAGSARPSRDKESLDNSAAMSCSVVEDMFRAARRLGRSAQFSGMTSTLPSLPRIPSRHIHGLGSARAADVEQAAIPFRRRLASTECCFTAGSTIVPYDTLASGFEGRLYKLCQVGSFHTSGISWGRAKPAPLYETIVSDIREEVKQALCQFMQQDLKVEKKLAAQIINNSPDYVNKLVEKLKPTVQPHTNLNLMVREVLAEAKFKGVEPYFESIGFTPQEIEKVSMYSRSGLAGVIAKVNLIKSIGIRPEEIPRVVTINPRSLSNALKSQEVKVHYLKQLGLSFDDIRKLVVSYPKALSFGLKNGSLPLVDFLRSKGVNTSEIGKVVVRCPQLLTLNVERKLQPAIEILGSVGITGSNLARVLVTQPSLLRRRLGANIEYCRKLGLDAKPGVIARLLVTCPNFSEDGCKARMSYLESTGLTKEQVVTMIIKNPAWLSFNVESSLSLKVNYLVNVMGRSVQELVTASTFLTMSLENRIMPRWTVLSAMEKVGLLKKTYSLSTLVTWSDDYFYERFVDKCPKEIKKLWFAPSCAEEDNLPKDQQPVA